MENVGKWITPDVMPENWKDLQWRIKKNGRKAFILSVNRHNKLPDLVETTLHHISSCMFWANELEYLSTNS